MKFKHLMLIALALCLCFAVAPVAAVWNGENWVAEDHNALCDKVVFDSWSGNTNCYRDINPSIALQNSIDTHQGTVKFIIRAGYPTLSPSVSISNDLSTDPNETVSVAILPDGEVEYQLAAGNYTAVLDNFNLPDETAHFVIVPGKESFVPFVGQAAGSISKHVVVYTILDATYGATRQDCFDAIWSEWSREKPCKGDYQTRTVTDSLAWDEQIAATYKNIHHDATYTYSIVTGSSFTGYAKPVNSHSDHDFTINGQDYQIVDNSCNGHDGVVKYKKILDHAAYDESVIDVAAHIVHHGAVTHIEYRYITNEAHCDTYGKNLDVTQNVQHIVDSGVTTLFFFDNAQNPGGIFSQGNVLLSPINDPAYGIVKNVYIHYTKDGVDKTINTMEYSQISL